MSVQLSLLLLVLFVLSAGLAVAALRRFAEQRAQTTALAAALGSIAGTCYRIAGGRILRLDGHAGDAAAPLDLTTMLEYLDPAERAAVDSKMRTLVLAGTGFFEQVRPTGSARILELSGHRLTARRSFLATTRPIDVVWLSDVTERVAATVERLRAERELGRLREVVDRLPLAVWWRDQDMAIRGNRQFGAAEGFDAASRPLAESAAASGEAAHGRFDSPANDGAGVFDLVELPAQGGGTIGFATDRTEAHQLKQQLERLSIGHQQVLEAVGTAIAIWAPDARLMFSNSAFERLWGLERDWLRSEPSLNEVLDRLRELRALPEYADFRKFKAEQLALFSELRERREELLHLPDERTLRVTVTPHPFGGLIFTYEDVTDRLALERSYNTLTEVQRETLDNLFEGIAVFGSDGRLKLWNPVYAEIWQLGPGDLAGRPHIGSIVERARALYETGEDWEETKRRAVERVTSYAATAKRIERRDGTALELNVVPLPDGNVLLTYLDVTDTARVQRALRDKQDALETATRLKSEFIANVSYELRTPLNAIIGFAEILTNQYFGPLNDRQLDYSRGVLESSQRLLSLINDILDLAAIEAGQLVLEREPVDVHTLLASVLALTQERARRFELRLGFDCPTDLGIILADERRIRQALFNLVSNAVKFTPAEGSITLSACRVGSEVALTVADTGIGIEPEQLSKVFEKFERGDPATRAVGAGLGLSLVKSFVELHGGRVQIDSTVGKGTRVTCWLPAGSRPATARPVTRRRPGPPPRDETEPSRPTLQ